MLWSSFHFPLIFYPIALLSTNTYITISSNGALKPNLARGCLKPFYPLSKKGGNAPSFPEVGFGRSAEGTKPDTLCYMKSP